MRRIVYISNSFDGNPSIKLKLLMKKRKQTSEAGKKQARCNALSPFLQNASLPDFKNITGLVA
jgi:hypothetical protein